MSDRLRLVVMGDSYVGKSSIIKRFLFNTFSTKYVTTVEDLFSRDYDIAGTALNVDILDTAGDAQFPAMRRLSISSAHAFLLVFSVTNPDSFTIVKHRVEEIKEQRKDFQEIPIVIAANKIDLVRECEEDEILDWVKANMQLNRTDLINCSASENINISEIFKSFLRLSKINLVATGLNSGNATDPSSWGDNSALRRNFSAYGRLRSPKRTPVPRSNVICNLANEAQIQYSSTSSLSSEGHNKVEKKSSLESPCSPNTPRSEKKFFGISFSPFGSPNGSSILGISPKEFETINEKSKNGFQKSNKTSKRSRSLIRRSSKKVKQQVNSFHNPDDCVIS